MKAKCVPQTKRNSYKFFLLMVVPLLLGALIALTSSGNATWDNKDATLAKSPSQQGWTEFKAGETS
jgi:hypothetical protein